ncbi:MAG: NADH-quinone oxidoreductase subunit H [Elusimicrobiota bacterium]|jgi:NADH-quinone oxidoreductase subunit H|nr:NADH-quinone oxidoreductase subunit H [Elusimicrobiota bacterium]
MEYIKEILCQLFSILIYPGLLFLAVAGLTADWLDRKLYARMQNRQGPPWFQPLADFVKLVSKETIIPKSVDSFLFKVLPYIAVAAVVSCAMMIPFDGGEALIDFPGDLIVTAYFLSIPIMCFFLIGWYSSSPYAAVGSMRVLTQFFAYEVPLTLVLISPAIIAGSWSISDIAYYYYINPLMILFNILGFAVALITMQGKLERVPFDIPHAETEIVGGVFTEYSGKLYGFIRLAVSIEMIIVCALISAVFLGGSLGFEGIAGFMVFAVKLLFLIFISALIRSLMARVRIEQMINFCWRVLTPLAIVQIIIAVCIAYNLNRPQEMLEPMDNDSYVVEEFYD